MIHWIIFYPLNFKRLAAVRGALRWVASIISLIGRSSLCRKRRQYLVEYTKTAPADEAVIDCFVRAVVLRRIAPAKAIADDKDDTAQNSPVINPGNAVRKRKIRRHSPHLCVRKPNQITHASSPPGTTESDRKQPRK